MFIAILAFVFTTILLYLSSRALTNNLIRFFIRLTKSPNKAAHLLFFIFLPGIFLHEFSHILTAEFLRVPTGHLSLKPHLKHNQLRLGSAQIAATDPFRLTLIGSAPFIIGILILWAILTLGLNINLSTINLPTLKHTLQAPYYILLPSLYFLITITNTMFSSPSDLQAAGMPLILILILLGTFKLAHLQPPQIIISSFTNLFLLLATIFFLMFILNLLSLFFLKILNKKSP